jgi:hypothetical protein
LLSFRLDGIFARLVGAKWRHRIDDSKSRSNSIDSCIEPGDRRGIESRFVDSANLWRGRTSIQSFAYRSDSSNSLRFISAMLVAMSLIA